MLLPMGRTRFSDAPVAAIESGGSAGWAAPPGEYAAAEFALPNHSSAKPSEFGGISPPWKWTTIALSGCCPPPSAVTAEPRGPTTLVPMSVRSIAHGQLEFVGCGQKRCWSGVLFTHFTLIGVPFVPRMFIAGYVEAPASGPPAMFTWP